MGRFEFPGVCGDPKPFGGGHINDTYLLACRNGGGDRRYILQRINHAVFKDPARVMENIARVTTHIRGKLEQSAGATDIDRHVLRLLRTRDGGNYHRDGDGNYWRAYRFVGEAHTYDKVESPAIAYEAGCAFGRFQRLLSDLPAPRLHETIPHFHDTPSRYAALEAAIERDPRNRAAAAAPEIAFALRHAAIAPVLEDMRRAGKLAERTTHNDTKVNNVLFDDTSRKAICILDLDTVMPGLALYDFGDLVRTATNTALEDEQDLLRVGMSMPIFESLARGYVESAGDFLEPESRALLAFAGKLIAFETGIRFLADHLDGDMYFKVHRPNHNLDRCRTQFRLVESIEAREEAMNRFVAGLG